MNIKIETNLILLENTINSTEMESVPDEIKDIILFIFKDTIHYLTEGKSELTIHKKVNNGNM